MHGNRKQGYGDHPKEINHTKYNLNKEAEKEPQNKTKKNNRKKYAQKVVKEVAKISSVSIMGKRREE